MEPILIQGNQFLQNGKPIVFRGFGLGNWLMLEHFMLGIPGTHSQIEAVWKNRYGDDGFRQIIRAYRTSYFSKDDAAFLKTIGANIVRIPFHYKLLEGPESETVLRLLDDTLSFCAENSLYAVLDLHSAPGGQNPDWHCDNPSGFAGLWEEPALYNRLAEVWKTLARRYRNHTEILGFDLLNEPTDPENRTKEMVDLYRILIEAVRSEDPERIVFLEGLQYGRNFRPLLTLQGPNIAYSFHNYPIFAWKSIRKLPRNERREALKKSMLGDMSVEEFYQTFNTPLWCGETGSPRDQLSPKFAAELAEDMTLAMKDLGISWTYWSYKDRGVMGLLSPRKPIWQNWNRSISGNWLIWKEMENKKAVHLKLKSFGLKPENHPTLAAKLNSRGQADTQLILLEKSKAFFETVSLEEALEAMHAYSFKNCLQWKEGLSAIGFTL